MARSLDDIVSLQVKLTGSITIDLERVEADPIWQDFLSSYSSLPLYDVLQMYISYYIQADKFLSDAPFTNGPGNLVLEQLEVNNGY